MITDKLSPEELALLTNIIAIEICKGKKPGEMAIIATIYSSIASQMFLIAAQTEYINSMQTTTTENASVVSAKSASRDTKRSNINNKGIREK